jgi:hypothetical protein
MKILFITSRNAYSTCGELRLIKNRAITLKEEFGITTDFILFKHKKILKKRQEILPYSSFDMLTYGLFSYVSTFRKLNQKILTKIRENKYQCVILSGIGMPRIVKKIKEQEPSLKCIVDIHGAYEELIEFTTNSFIKNIFRKIFYRVAKHGERKYFKYFDGYLAVSHALETYIKREYKIKNNTFFIVPCAISNSIPKQEELVNKRNESRHHYHVTDDEILFIYSGGVSPWQNIRESVELFKTISKHITYKCKMLILSGDLAAIKKYESENVQIDSLSADNVQNVICAGDYAFMLRGDFITNNVAFPNKFLEYVSCGMDVIATPYVYDVKDYIKEYNLGIVVPDNISETNWEYFDRETKYPDNYEGRKRLIEHTSFKNTLKPLVDYISK